MSAATKPGQRLPRLDPRDAEHWTQAERLRFAIQMAGGPRAVAALIGKGLRTVARYQSGNAWPDVRTLDRIRAAAALAPNFFFAATTITGETAGPRARAAATWNARTLAAFDLRTACQWGLSTRLKYAVVKAGGLKPLERRDPRFKAATWARYLSGQREPTTEAVRDLAEVSGLPAVWLAFGIKPRIRVRAVTRPSAPSA
jgi:hypothetical protein